MDSPCVECEGRGYTFKVKAVLDTYKKCWYCDGTGLKNDEGPDDAGPCDCLNRLLPNCGDCD